MKRSFVIVMIGMLFQSCAATVSHRQTIDNEPMLIGIIDQNELFREFPVFKKNYDAYVPNDSAIGSLKTFSEKVHIEIFLGTWCGDSKRNLAAFLKTLDLAGMSNMTYTMRAVDRTKKDKEHLTDKFAITRVPTMVFLKNGTEIGRITESPNLTVEYDLLNIISKP